MGLISLKIEDWNLALLTFEFAVWAVYVTIFTAWNAILT